VSCSRHPARRSSRAEPGFPGGEAEGACLQPVPAPRVWQLSPMSRGGEMVYIPDDSDFSSFRDQCESLEGWHCRYNKAGVTVWSQGQEESCTVQKIKVSRCRRLRDHQPSPAPAACPTAPEGPWHAGPSWGCKASLSSLPGGVPVPNAGAGGVSPLEALLASGSAGSHFLPHAFSLSTCRDARCSVLPCMHVGSCCSCP